MESLKGIHHVTAMAGDPQANVDFYCGIIGLRLVKLTVNFDDPNTYHLYYGDAVGSPGTVLTFFPLGPNFRATTGAGEVTTVGFAVPKGSLPFWQEHLGKHSVAASAVAERWGLTRMELHDPDGLKLELVEDPTPRPFSFWNGGGIPESFAVRGFSGLTISVASGPESIRFLTDRMGAKPQATLERSSLLAIGESERASAIEVISLGHRQRGQMGAGSVHHMAWRVTNEDEQLAWRSKLTENSVGVTPVRDRKYFRSIYFREPGEVLLEIATDPPGFTVDEPRDSLGSELQLPEWLECERRFLQKVLPPLKVPAVGTGSQPSVS
jgi:Lactoylglutathione lyase and related lyases